MAVTASARTPAGTAIVEIQVRIGHSWENPVCSREEATYHAPALIDAHTQAAGVLDVLRTTDPGTWGESHFRLVCTDEDGSVTYQDPA